MNSDKVSRNRLLQLYKSTPKEQKGKKGAFGNSFYEMVYTLDTNKMKNKRTKKSQASLS